MGKSEKRIKSNVDDGAISVKLWWVVERLLMDSKMKRRQKKESMLKLVGCLVSVIKVRLRGGLVGSSFVLMMVIGVLGMSFVMSGVMMRNIIERPMERVELLNLDYTKTKPASSVVLPEVGSKHKLQLMVSLTLPLSEYNTRLGMFQIRLESVSPSGEVRAHTSKAASCTMELRPFAIFKTSHILNINMKALTLEPQDSEQQGFSFIRVIIEPRASSPSSIPQISEASLSIKSHHLSLFHSLLWNFKFTIFVWTSFVFFFVLLFFFYSCYVISNHKKGGK